jgi:orotate phosphoribosyltransferase
MAVSYFLELGVDTERTRRILELAHVTGALLHGDFTLSSGKKSDHYFEGKRLTLHPEGAYLIGKEVLGRLAGTDVEAIGGLVMGAFPIITAVAVVSHQEGRPIPTFIVREQPKEHGTRRKIEGHFKKGSKVAIVDDVITTGGSVLKAIKAVEEEGCKVVKVIVIVDRNEGGSEQLREEGYDFDAIINLPPTGEASISESASVKGEAGARILHQ